jgi:predicted GH43/DUF377 family glycosyl hydrolase
VLGDLLTGYQGAADTVVAMAHGYISEIVASLSDNASG